MKPIMQVTRCENCDAIIELVSPPPKEQYKMGRIQIKDGTVLLSRPSQASAHCAFFSGYYCTPTCLANKIETLRKSA